MNTSLRLEQTLAKELWNKRGYIADLPTLGLGLCEEAGELAKAINLQNPLYIPKNDVVEHDIEHEIYDCFMYLIHIANKINIELDLDQYIVKKLNE